MGITASKLRQNIYRLLDTVIQTGKPLEIERKGKKLKIVPGELEDRLSKLKKRDIINGDPEDLVHIDWSSEWQEKSI